jgi:hypothetical protein
VISRRRLLRGVAAVAVAAAMPSVITVKPAWAGPAGGTLTIADIERCVRYLKANDAWHSWHKIV